MSDNKMLQAILDGQRAIREELRGDIKKVERNLAQLIRKNEKHIRKNGERLDKIGKAVAYFEDDAPTIEDFDDLEKRVGKLEKTVSSV